MRWRREQRAKRDEPGFVLLADSRAGTVRITATPSNLKALRGLIDSALQNGAAAAPFTDEGEVIIRCKPEDAG